MSFRLTRIALKRFNMRDILGASAWIPRPTELNRLEQFLFYSSTYGVVGIENRKSVSFHVAKRVAKTNSFNKINNKSHRSGHQRNISIDTCLKWQLTARGLGPNDGLISKC